MNICYFCGDIKTTFCNLCGQYFCEHCKKHYAKRIIAMVKTKFAKKGLKWFTRKEIDDGAHLK